ncbi:hypothetical protein EFB08_17240 [Rufibacter latericius]|uniref:Uncharacterized protein n=1 Tax=Rufibacter latericius TaxID=2487040 RepID=A0A3M9MEY4_9BACT|nr:hypothetical protein EFB08_17240 [Rufibacter latericius]
MVQDEDAKKYHQNTLNYKAKALASGIQRLIHKTADWIFPYHLKLGDAPEGLKRKLVDKCAV